MKELTSKVFGDTVSDIYRNDDDMFKRLRIKFVNGYQLSIITGPLSYGGDQGLFEIAPFNKEGELDGKLLNLIGDDVIGYLTDKEVMEYARQLSILP